MREPHAPAFFSGLLTGLLLLSLAGWMTTRADQYSGIVHFHRYVNPESLVFPTASQVTAHARAAARPDQTLVIVGGSSIVFGAGQGTDELWTDELQRLIGDSYGVANLALPAGTPGEHGSVAAQALLQEGRDVVFVVLAYPDIGGVDGNRYPYVVWDARARGMLLPSDERDRLMERLIVADGSRLELQVRSQLDEWLNFSDLWETLAVRQGSLIWQPFVVLEQPWYGPRLLWPDPVPPILPREGRYAPAADAPTMAVLETETRRWCTRPDPTWQTIRDPLAAQIPPLLRERTVALLTARSPYFTHRLPSEQQACRDEHLRMLTASMRAEGYRALLAGTDWADDDFVDLVHPSGEGGRKLAEAVAPLVREIADR